MNEEEVVEAKIEALWEDACLQDRSVHYGHVPGQPKFAVVAFQGFAPDDVLGEGETPEAALQDAMNNRPPSSSKGAPKGVPMTRFLHALGDRIGVLAPSMWFRFFDITLFGLRVQVEMTSLDLEDAIGKLERLVDDESDARSARALLEALERRVPDHPRIVRLAVMLRLLDDWVNDVGVPDDAR